MNAYILLDEPDLRNHAMSFAMDWLEEKGGGTYFSETKDNMCGMFDILTESQMDRLKSNLADLGILLLWRRKGVPTRGNVVAAYIGPERLAEITKYSKLDNLLVLAWGKEDWSDWIEANGATRLSLPEKERKTAPVRPPRHI